MRWLADDLVGFVNGTFLGSVDRACQLSPIVRHGAYPSFLRGKNDLRLRGADTAYRALSAAIINNTRKEI
ncbi:hypothetical protein [Spirosoma foliorum]|uniref:Uncharacterized protein n=1 Tax=Spirosoma foliorum TaxID=2710596 RepID=A0A7G5GRI7_9BACT|nr:hypothetical protein [Spirosoma foliorum]QMW01479.1 hypothetical protein H3H32_26485 [Spirosoma foliorum]